MLRVRVLIGVSRDRHVIEAEGSAGHVVLFKFVLVLDAFDPEEGKAEKHGEDEHRDQDHATPGLRGPDGEDDGQAAADQDGCVGGAKGGVYRLAGSSEIAEIPSAID